MKAHESSVGELRGRGRAGTRDMAAGHHRNTWGLGDTSLGGYWICVRVCAGYDGARWCRDECGGGGVVTTAPMWSVAVSGCWSRDTRPVWRSTVWRRDTGRQCRLPCTGTAAQSATRDPAVRTRRDNVTPPQPQHHNTEQSFPRNSNYSNANIVGVQVVSTKISRHGASTADQFWYSEAASGRNIWSWVFAFRSPSNLLLELSVENLKKVVLNPRHVEILWIRPLVNWIISIHQI